MIATRLSVLCCCKCHAWYAGQRDINLQPAAQAVQTAHAYFSEEVTDGGTPPQCHETCMKLSEEPRLSFGLLFLAVGTRGRHEAHLPFRVRAARPSYAHIQHSHG